MLAMGRSARSSSSSCPVPVLVGSTRFHPESGRSLAYRWTDTGYGVSVSIRASICLARADQLC